MACPRGAMIRPDPPLSDQHPTGINPARDGGRASLACWLRVPRPRLAGLLRAKLLENGHDFRERHARCRGFGS